MPHPQHPSRATLLSTPDEPQEEHQAPGGSTVNRVASVATSAALGGAAAGALAGVVAGPVGVAVGAAIGAVAAGFAGNAAVDAVDAEVEERYWRSHFSERPYVGADAGFDDFGPAYRYGVDGYVRHRGRPFDEVESELAQGWEGSRGSSRLEWERARHATRDGWERLGNTSGRAVAGKGDDDRRNTPPSF